jgi:ribosomal protein S18 acetylase RimI-like enzyme
MIEIFEADPRLPEQAQAIVDLMDTYARDPMGGGEGLSDRVKADLPAELAKRQTAHIILALSDREPAGLVVCFEGFSTFACQPLLNIHDVIVAPAFRCKGLAKRMLHKAEQIAMDLGCCKLTLEVLEGNHMAQAVYRSCGFAGYELDPKMGNAMFWQKKLAP